MYTKSLYAIRYVSLQTGLSPYVLRAWEKRYKAVVPNRSPKNRRLYSDEDIKRLKLLKQITDAGHNISQVASLKTSELLELAQRLVSAIPARQTKDAMQPVTPVAANEHYKKCLSAVLNLDPEGLEKSFDRTAVDLSRSALLKEVVVPLLNKVGELWREGRLKIINEHMATSVTRTFLLSMLKATEISESAPKIFIATPVGQWHDVGALAVALMAAESGWQPVYYGPNLPAEEIAAGVKQSRARAVAISITHLLQLQPLKDELRRLRRYIGSDLAIFIGGRAMGKGEQRLEEINIQQIQDLDQFAKALNKLR